MKKKSEKQKLFTVPYIIAFLIYTLVFLVHYSLVSIIPLILSEKMSASPSQVGTVLGLSSVGILFIRPILGYVLDRWAKKKILFVSLLFLGFSYILLIFAKTLLTFLIFRLIQIILFAAASTALITIATDLILDERKGEGLSYFTTASTLALGIGPVLGIALYNSKLLYLPYLVSGIGAFICVFFIKLLRFSDSPGIHYKKITLKSLFDSRVLAISCIIAFGYMGALSLLSFGTLYLTEINKPTSSISFVFTCFAFGILLFRILTAKLIDKGSPKNYGVLSMSLLALGLFITGIFKTYYCFYIGAFLVGGGVGILLPMGLSMAIDITSIRRRGLCTGLIYSGIDIGASLGPVLFGYLREYFNNYSSAFIIFSLVEIIAIFLFRFLVFPIYLKKKNTKYEATYADNSQI